MKERRFLSPQKEISFILQNPHFQKYTKANLRKCGLYKYEADEVINNVFINFNKAITSNRIQVECRDGLFSYVRVQKKGEKVNQPINIPPYLKRSIYNEILKLLNIQNKENKSIHGQKNCEYEDEKINPRNNHLSGNLFQKIIEKDHQNELRSYINLVQSELYKTILFLCYFENASNTEIHQILIEKHQYQSSLGAVRTAKSRAKKELMKIILQQKNL